MRNPDGDRNHSGGFKFRFIPPSWHPVPVCVPRLRCRRAVLRCSNDCCRRNYFLLQQRKLESGAGRCRGRDRFHSGGFFLRIMPHSWHPVPACTPRLRCRRTVLHRHDDCAASIRKSGPENKNRCSSLAVLEGFLASIPKSGLEFKNRCTNKAVSEENIAAIPKFDP